MEGCCCCMVEEGMLGEGGEGEGGGVRERDAAGSWGSDREMAQDDSVGG